MQLPDKSFIVTGSSRGLGAETARQLKGAGARVIGMDLHESQENVDRFIQMDLSNKASIEKACNELDERVHGLCNIAGVAPTLAPDLVLKINFLGTRYLTTLLEPKMCDDGSIVNIASGTAMGWGKNIAKHKVLMQMGLEDDIAAFCRREEIVKANCYAFSKEAMIVWMLAEWKKREVRGIRMNSISPGPIETPLLPDFFSDMMPADAPMYEMERGTASVEEIANVILFLCDDLSSWIHAANIPVDGGLSAIVYKRIFQF